MKGTSSPRAKSTRKMTALQEAVLVEVGIWMLRNGVEDRLLEYSHGHSVRCLKVNVPL